MCGAIKKLGKEGQVRCLGFENAHLNEQYATDQILEAIVKQNVAGQARLATEMAKQYCKDGVFPKNGSIMSPPNLFYFKSFPITKVIECNHIDLPLNYVYV